MKMPMYCMSWVAVAKIFLGSHNTVADDRRSKAYADDMELLPAVGQFSERA